MMYLKIFLLTLPMSFGFRMFPGGNDWSISKADPTIWLKSCQSINFEYSGFPAGDALELVFPTYNQALQSIADDFNVISGSYLRLALYPSDPSNPGTPATGDSTFTLDKAQDRSIEICFSQQDVTAGQAQPKWNNQGKMVGCKIELNEKLMNRAQVFVQVLTHELGHCLGLDHPQETTYSIMSYYSNVVRLQLDDKMGLSKMYPEEEAFGKETATYGMSCQTR